MSRWMQKLATALTLSAYLLAVVAASLHHHSHEHPPLEGSFSANAGAEDSEQAGHSHRGHSHAGHCHGHSGHCHSHTVAETHSHDHNHPHHHGGFPHDHHDDCVVCQFLALKTVSTSIVTVVGVVEVVCFEKPQSVSRPDAPVLGLPLSRGPPSTIEV